MSEVNGHIKSLDYSWVNYAKGIGIILVVYGHVARGVFNAGLIENESLFRLVDNVIYSFHMPLFFFISGLFFVNSIQNRGAVGLIKSKVDTIVYPYFAWSLIQGSIEYGMSSVTNSSKTVVDIYSILWAPIDQFWFLYALFLVFVIVAIVYKLTQRAAYLFSLSLILFLLSSYLVSPWDILNSSYKFVIFFCGGIVFFTYKSEGFNNQNKWFWGAGLTVVFLQWLLHIDFFNLNIERYVGVLAAFSAITVVVFISKLLARLSFGFIRVLGSQSLEIYLLHVLFGSGFRIVLQKYFEIESSVLHLFFGTIVGVVGTVLFVLLIKRFDALYLFRTPRFLRQKN